MLGQQDFTATNNIWEKRKRYKKTKTKQNKKLKVHLLYYKVGQFEIHTYLS
jgi:hypothetical protein